VGSLNNLCQQLGISSPKYTYSNSATGFECHGQLYNLDGKIVSASGIGRNKKHSKQIAANELLKQLDYEGEIEDFSY
jgi:dsRNA-specific ribonuclease